MKIEILKESGYCFGVKKAIELAKNVKNAHKHQNVYILGMLVHNEYVINELSSLGIITIDVEPNKYYEEIKKLHENDVLIFTAHGHDKKLNKLAKKQNLIIYDAICPMVNKNNELIKNALKEKNKVIYIGKKDHPEAVGALSIDENNIILYTDKLLNNNYLDINNQYYVINQTTLNYDEIEEIFNNLKSAFPNIKLQNEVCNATRIRQKSIINLDEKYDCLLIVGSNKSSNTNKLFEIAKEHKSKRHIYLIDSLNKLDEIDFSPYENIAITGGTSTPNDLLIKVKDTILFKQQ